ncbi:MAG: hypothetical protein U1E14_07335 [Geminicoccaceae bacterium]
MPDHAGFVDAIALVLADCQAHLPRLGRRVTGWGPTIADFRPVAEIMATRLEAQGFEVSRKAPAAGHRTP